MGIMRENSMVNPTHASTRFGIWMAALDSSDGYAQPAISGAGPDDASRTLNFDLPEMIGVARPPVLQVDAFHSATARCSGMHVPILSRRGAGDPRPPTPD